jgi:predicted nucleic acid-binding protein
MLYYLDTVIVIYAVEGQPQFRQRAQARIAALEAIGHRFAISELTRTECLVVPFQVGNGPLLLDYFRFFHGPHVRTVCMTSAIHERASMIRGSHHYASPQLGLKPLRYSLADAHHLAAAIEAGCTDS